MQSLFLGFMKDKWKKQSHVGIGILEMKNEYLEIAWGHIWSGVVVDICSSLDASPKYVHILSPRNCEYLCGKKLILLYMAKDMIKLGLLRVGV